MAECPSPLPTQRSTTLARCQRLPLKLTWAHDTVGWQLGTNEGTVLPRVASFAGVYRGTGGTDKTNHTKEGTTERTKPIKEGALAQVGPT